MYLHEIQGLRVVAALLVAVYHIWFQRVSGGVDAFFVISGFFLYRTLFKTVEPKIGDVLKYYQRTFARVAPSACIVIAATCAGFIFLDVNSLWLDQIESAIASMFFVENWRLAMTGTDYLAQGELPSPFQQMWALSVQMQMYVVLPLALLALVWIKRQLNTRYSFLGITMSLTALAFVYALIATAQNQPFAYFNTFARIWEFLAGMILAMCLPRLILSVSLARGLGYAGLFVLVTFPAVIPVGQSFPGVAALVPVLATSSIIVAASNGAGMTVLNAPVMQVLGNLSFTFYLWHWPLLIGYRLMSGQDNVGLIVGLIIIGTAGILAFFTYRFAEQPFRKSRIATARPLFSIGASAFMMVPVAGIVGVWALSFSYQADVARNMLAAFVRGEAVTEMVPATIIAKQDVHDGRRGVCSQRFGLAEVLECVYGNPNGKNTAVLVGGSHSAHWLPALQGVAQVNPTLKIITLVKAGCPLTLSPADNSSIVAVACSQWSRSAVERINELEPDVVVTLLTSTRQRDGRPFEAIPDGFVAAWKAIPDVPILAIRDNARAPHDIVLCVDRMTIECDFIGYPPLELEFSSEVAFPENVYPLDLTATICPDGICEAVQGGVLAYRDDNHFIATYARTFAPDIAAALMSIGVLK